MHGFCSSPVLYKDLVILNGDQDADGYLVALDKATGEEKLARRPAQQDALVLHADPHPRPKRPGETQLVLSGSKCVAGYDPDTGKLLWIIDGPTEQYVASLVCTEGMLFLTAGFPEYHLMGIRPDGDGQHHRQQARRLAHPAQENGPRGASYVPSPLAHDGHFFVVSDEGYSAASRRRRASALWMEKLGRRHSASPVLVAGAPDHPRRRRQDVRREGGPEVRGRGEERPGRGECYASPAVSRGQLFLRTVKHLYCIGE